MTNTTVQQVAAAAWRIRRYALRMGEVQGQGYIGQALGYADVLATAFAHGMTFRAQEPEWEGRDRFLLSHGHYAIAYYAALIEAGIVPEEELETYGSDDSRLPMSGMATNLLNGCVHLQLVADVCRKPQMPFTQTCSRTLAGLGI